MTITHHFFSVKPTLLVRFIAKISCVRYLIVLSKLAIPTNSVDSISLNKHEQINVTCKLALYVQSRQKKHSEIKSSNILYLFSTTHNAYANGRYYPESKRAKHFLVIYLKCKSVMSWERYYYFWNQEAIGFVWFYWWTSTYK